MTVFGRRSPTAARVAAAALLMLQSGAALALPGIDASLELRAGGSLPHVEAPTADHQHPGHDHLECVVCRTVIMVGSAWPVQADVTVPLDRTLRPTLTGTRSARRPARRSRLGPRAPPRS